MNFFRSSLSRIFYSLIISFSINVSVIARTDILLIHSYHAEHGWTTFLKQGFNDAFSGDNNTRLFHEYMDSKRYPKGEFRELFINYLRDKYQNTELAAIVVSDDSALNFIREKRADFFPDVPIVYLGINRVTEALLKTPNMTGIFENRDIAKTVLDIKAHTGFDEIVVVTDKSDAGKANLWKISQIKRHPDAPSKITIIDDLKDNEIVHAFRDIDEHVPILLIGQLISPSHNNALLSWNQGTEALSQSVKNPIYTIAITTLEYGAVGAHELDGRQHANRTAQLIKRLIAGEPISDIEPVTKANSRWIFNWNNMMKHNISSEKLPLDARIIHKEKSFYQQYKLIVWLVGCAFIIFIIVIILLSEVIRRGERNRKLLSENEARYKDLAYAGASIFWETDKNHCITYLSGDTKTVFHVVDSQLILGHSLESLFYENPLFDFPWDDYHQALSDNFPLENLIFKMKLSEKKVKIFMINAKPISNHLSHVIGYRGICKEITQEYELSQQLAYQADYDSLTGLISRANFNNKLKIQVKEQQNKATESFLCFLDLDNFKLVNDTAGHLIGDAMLAEVATIIQQLIGSKDIIGRLGGDEFGLIIKSSNQSEVLTLCEKIINNVSNYKFHWNNRYFDVGVSIGAVHIAEGLSTTELLSKADLSCYKAKDLGKGRVYIADLSGNDLYNDELQMGYISSVSQVIEQEQFYLVKQLIKPLKNDANIHKHYEILIRYRDENGETVPPGLFIPAAEKHGVITLIDQWVLTTVFQKYYTFFPEGNTTLSINLSGISLSNKEFVNTLTTLVKTSNIDPTLLCFEITETAAISQLSQALEFIHEMKTLGIKFALDDFGSGASSFGYLKKLPVDYLKIDGCLVRNIVTEPTDRAIVASINEIAHMMGMQTIAEFVENEQIQAVLCEIGVDYVQGYGIEKPRNC